MAELRAKRRIGDARNLFRFTIFEIVAMNEREIFLSALEIDDLAARRAHIQTACAGDSELLARVESLLSSFHVQPVLRTGRDDLISLR